MSDLFELSRSIADLHATFEPHVGHAVELEAGAVKACLARLQTMMVLARAMEVELSAHRRSEANRFAPNMVEELATDVMRNLVDDASSNVVRPNFGRKA